MFLVASTSPRGSQAPQHLQSPAWPRPRRPPPWTVPHVLFVGASYINIYIWGWDYVYYIYMYLFIYLYVCSFIYLYVIYIYAPSNPKNLPTFPLAIHRLPLQRLPCALLRDLHGKYAIEAKLIVGPAVVHLPILGHRRSARPKSGFQPLPSGNFTYWKCTIYSWFTYSKWWFSIAKC